jgi:hypothetical protein
VAQPSSAYEPRDPTSTILYGIVRDHFETFRADAASLRDGEGLPRFVQQEFRDFLRCACLAGGFARFRCADCGLDRLVAFSCKGTRAGQRDRLERLCRYALRPPLAQDRLHTTSEGEIWLALRHRWADGTTHLRFDPLELLERLAVLTPRPRVNLTLYYGVLAPRAAWRSALIPVTADGVNAPDGESCGEPDDASCAAGSVAGAHQWAELMRRTFGVDVLACPRCGRQLRLVALIDQASVIQRILRYLGLPTDVPEPRPARAPPRHLGPEDQSQQAPDFDAAW